ncbi:MAG: FHA domain-containing protein [Phototrophicaceae bacterium]|jgi:pSer/pThr/pTyr-binding forkhead associated (FHA) protein
MPSLRIKWEDPTTGKPVQYNGEAPIKVGRSRSNEVILNTPCAFNAHAVIEMAQGKITLCDVGSSNGTTGGGI